MTRAPALLVALGLLGCLEETNPCPPGLEVDPRTQRCVWSDEREPDAGPRDAEPHDAAPADVGVDAPPPRCPEAELAAWRALHRGPELGATIRACSARACTSSPCDVASCLADAASIAVCDACVAVESLCATQRCPNACTRASDAECRACLCEAGCVEAFESCAVARLSLCDDAFGRDASADELALSTPVIVRRKSATGFTRATAFYPDDPSRDDDRQTHASIGHSVLTSFAHRGVDFVVEHLGACGGPLCPARISPALRDGTLGRPAFLGAWSRGYDVVVPFRVDGVVHLFLYKSGGIHPEEGPRGSARIERVEGDHHRLLLTTVFEGAWTPPVGPAWTHVRAFAVEDTTYLLQYRGGEGHAVELTRVVPEGDTLRFERVARELRWSADWTVVETFPVGARWFVLQYARQEEGEGRVRVSALDHDARGEPLPSLPILATTWPDTTHVHAFRTAAATYFLRRDQASGRADFVRLPASPAAWASSPGELVETRTWGAAPPWDVVGVIRARLWEEP